MTRADRDRWVLTDPTTTLAEIMEQGRARRGRTIVAYVGDEPQEVLAVRSLPTPVPYRGDDETTAHEAMSELRDQLLAIAQEIVPERTFVDGRWEPMLGTLVTVVCRDGYVVSTADEMQYFPAWRYSNHFTVATQGDVFVATPHGWTGTLSEACGLRPSLPQLA